MLLRHRPPGIDPRPARSTSALPHVSAEHAAVLRWLRDHRVEHVLVGPLAEAIRGGGGPGGPVAIVPAPYRRNLDRLARALFAMHARLRVDTEEGTVPIKVSQERLSDGSRLRLRVGSHDLDIESRPEGAPEYQELLYEAMRVEVEPGLAAEVASPEDLELFAQIRRTGRAPQIRITRSSG